MNLLVYETTLLRLAFSLGALVFALVLYGVLKIQYAGDETHGKGFEKLVLIVMLGNLVSCASYFLRAEVLGESYPGINVCLVLTTYVANIFLTYYFAKYVESYFPEAKKLRDFMAWIHWGILIVSAISVVTYLCMVLPDAVAGTPIELPRGYRFFIAFAVELYFLFYTLFFFFFHKRFLDRRTYLTALGSFIVTIGGIIVEVVNSTGIFFNYFGATIGLYLFYIGVETPDYKNLVETMKSLELAKQMADDANRSKSDFLANMSHEIRTPINAVIGMNEMILRESRDNNITIYAKNIESAGKNLLSIINDILDFSKIEAGKMEIEEVPYKFSSVLNDVVNMVSFRAKSRNLEFEVLVDQTLPDGLVGDELRVRQVMVNLLNNAVKYTHEGKVTLEISGRERVSTLELKIVVKDTGIGIREEDLPKLFGKFSRVDLGQNRTVEGTGLGLAITYNLVEKMGGHISVSSVYGEGSVFTVMLPQKVVSRKPIGNYQETFRNSIRANNEYRETLKAPNACILVVDDTVMNLTVVKGLLKQTEVKIDTASGGMEALQKAKEKPYDLIFLDQRMPNMDGTETLHHLRSEKDGINADTPVICLTADAISGARERYLAEGFTDYLVKPVEGYAIEAMLGKYLPSEKVIRVGENDAAEEIVSSVSFGRTPGTESEGRNEPVAEPAPEPVVEFAPAPEPIPAPVVEFAPAPEPIPAPVAEPEPEAEEAQSELEAFYAGIPSLSYADAIRHTMDEGLLRSVLEQFVADGEDTANQVATFLKSRDYSNFTVKVHAIKSSTRLIGAMEISERAKELERLGNLAENNKDIEAVTMMRAQTPGLLKDFRKLVSQLQPLFTRAEDPDKEEIPAEDLAEFYETVAELSEAFDADTIENLISDIESNYRIPEDFADRFAAVKKAVGTSDWDRAKALCTFAEEP